MNEQEIEQAAEIVGALKDLFREFESRLGEIVSAQRIASSEARAEGAKVAKDLHELSSAARTLIDEQRALVSRLEREWQLRIDGNAQHAGEAQAQAFGAGIARGLQGQLEELAARCCDGYATLHLAILLAMGAGHCYCDPAHGRRLLECPFAAC